MRLAALCAVAGLVLLAAARAHADWRTDLSIKETPNDVLDIWAPGNFSLGFVGTSEAGAYLFLDGGFSRRISQGGSAESAGTYYQQADDCFISVNKDGPGYRLSSRADGGTCGGSPGQIVNAQSIVRVKHTAGGGAVVLANDSSGPHVYLSNTSIYDAAPFGSETGTSDTITGSMGLGRVGSTIHALLGTHFNTSSVYWVRSGVSELQAPSDALGIVQAIDVFAAGSPASPYAVVGAQNGFLQGSQGSSNPIQSVQRLPAGLGVDSVSMNVEAGSDAGTGFGMAIVSRPDGTGLAVMSPVPMLADTQAGTLWKFRPLPAGVATAPLKLVACTGASYCVFTAARNNGGNIFIYTNDAGPEISVSAPGALVVDEPMDASVVLNEGSPPVMVTLAANDLDDDPVLVTASPLSADTPLWKVGAADGGPGDPVVVTVTPGSVCQSQEKAGSFRVQASDGLAQHDAHKDIQVYVKHTLAPAMPPVVFPDGGVVPSGTVVGVVPAGTSALTLRVLGGDTTAAGCAIQKRWEPRFSGANVPSLVQGDGGTAVITPPRVFCEAGGGDFDVRLLVEDEGGLSSFKDFTVRVAPWGSPNAVFSPDTGVEHVSAGQSLVLGPNTPSHDCAGSPSFPGVVPMWNVSQVDGGVPGGGITFRDGIGGPPIESFPAPASRLVVETQHCLETQLRVTSVNHLGSAGGPAGPPSERQVMIQTDMQPFDAGVLSLELDARPPPLDELYVGVTSNLNCGAERGLHADLLLEPVGGGGPSQSATVDMNGGWRFPLGVGCQGGHFQLKASMAEGSGLRTPETTTDVVLPRLSAGLESLPEESVLVARCGEGARATLTQTFPQGACPTSAVTWSQVEGPPLEQASLSGGTVSLVTQDTGLDALVGRAVVVRVTADAGAGDVASLEHTLPITVEPFVKVRRRAEVPAASETGFVGVSVDLLNTTACGVSDVSYVERLEGLTYVEGSAKFNGQPVTATWADGALSVTGLSLEGDGGGTLTYVARPHLVGERRMEGEARLRDVPISIRDDAGPQVPDSGCGCTSSSPGPVLFALGALVAAVRRRRR
ncbi:MYXO-CTERM sorting domain-containing protein [Vitiosangium sp. GDMCC 1.1324]|uniref:MYXO-CTERM sorting domain-containing protein n=1 Tax=Vitiosangium sp. (strain GDMCC 1.1324) TaxID=2138576 RepID=UPI00130E88A3|nr:MYXO-CTERM sorting domain-containing protein [Vitiosangium sp. GDMCC 1.1324]